MGPLNNGCPQSNPSPRMPVYRRPRMHLLQREPILWALHALKSEGTRISNAHLAFLSPYGISNLKRFGNCRRTRYRTSPPSNGRKSVLERCYVGASVTGLQGCLSSF
jgi:hypothetical protein